MFNVIFYQILLLFKFLQICYSPLWLKAKILSRRHSPYLHRTNDKIVSDKCTWTNVFWFAAWPLICNPILMPIFYCCFAKRKMNHSNWNICHNKRIKGTLMQIWKSVIIFVFIWKYYVEDFTLKHLLFFEICARAICEKFVYKHSETIGYVKN